MREVGSSTFRVRAVRVVCTIAIALGAASCNRKPPSATAVLFVVDEPFEGERVVRNVAGDANPVVTQVSSTLSLSATQPNSYDADRWPDRFKTTARFADGTPIEAITENANASYGLSIVGWNGKRDITVRMTKK